MSVTSMKKNTGAGGKTALSVALYVAAYMVASGLDLWTTELAVRAGGHEANVYMTNAGIFDSTKAWTMTVVGGILMVWMFAFGIRNINHVSARWLRHAVRSFLRLYINPWAKSVIDRSPLHAVSYAIAFVLLRLLAAGNNLLIAIGSTGPIGAAVRAIGRVTSPEVGLIVVVGAIYVALAVILSPFIARLVMQHRKSTGRMDPAPIAATQRSV